MTQQLLAVVVLGYAVDLCLGGWVVVVSVVCAVEREMGRLCKMTRRRGGFGRRVW